jgi:hypothetical protein
MLTNNEIKAIVKTAFRPLRSDADIWDDDYSFRFRIFDEKNGIIEEKNGRIEEKPELLLQNVRDKAHLRTLLTNIRKSVIKKGYHLDHWVL